MGFLQRAEVTEGPGYLIAIAFHIALMRGVSTQHFGDVAGDTRLFGNADNHEEMRFEVQKYEIVLEAATFMSWKIRTFAAAMDKKNANSIRIKNKRATFEYFLVETLTAGIVLTGTEIKSIRGGKASLADSYCSFKGNELFVIGMHIAEYAQGTYNNHDPKRDRKLLLNARELRKLKNKVQEKGFTIVPVTLFINENGLAKLDIALARGKHYYDKRETLKTKDSKRELERLDRY